MEERNIPRLTNKICEKGLRYDLTVPFARFVVQHQNEISFPFKRYQIQPVWRADRPQKGRYREFYQCDVDVVGSDSLLNEVELVQIVDEVYKRLKINVRLLINNRKVLAGIAETIGHPDKLVDITVAIDKMDKIGAENVNAELREKGVSEEAIEKLQPISTLGRLQRGEVDPLARSPERQRNRIKRSCRTLHRVPLPESTGHPNRSKTRPDTCPRFELLHRSHFRGKSQGRGDREYHRRGGVMTT